MADCVLALDVGTSSARVIGYDASGQSIPGLRAQTHYALDSDPTGKAELDARKLLQNASTCIDQVLERIREQKITVAAVGTCTFWHSLVGVDSDGKAVTPIYTWADMRSATAAEDLRKQVGSLRVHERTGCALHPSYWPAKLVWLKKEESALFGNVRRWVSPGEYLYSQWFGASDCSVSMASGTGLFNQNESRWDEETLRASGLSPDFLPAVVDSDSYASNLRTEWNQRWPELGQIPWVLAIGDGAASNLGSGCATEERIAINLGTSGAIRVLWRAERVEIPEDLWCYRLDRRRFVMGAAFSDGGDAFAWAARTLGAQSKEAIEAELARRTPDCHRLTFLPFLAGERSMGWRPNARATLDGLSVTTSALEIIQAIMEGVAIRFALAADILEKTFPRTREIVVSGGAISASPVWARMIADAIGRPITLSTEPEASSRGAALLALRAAGMIEDEANVPAPLGETISPDPGRNALLRHALQRQQELYRRLL